MRRTCVPLLCAALILSLATPVAHAQASPPVTLDAVLQAALQQHPLLRAAQAQADAADAAVEQAGARPNPTLGIEQEDTRRDSRTTTVQLSQALELGGQRAARIGLARSRHELVQVELAARRAEVRAGAIQAFFEALVAQERVQVAEESLGLAAAGTAAVERRVTAGKVSPMEESRARVAEATARIELRQAQAEQQAALRALGLAMGLDGAAPSPLAGRADDLPVPPGPQALEERLAQSPALRRAHGEVQQAQAAYELERARRVPDLTVSLGAKRSRELGRQQALIGVSIPLPVFDANQGAQREALRRRDAAQALAEAEALRLRAEARQAVDQWQARVDEAQALQQELLPAARRAHEAASSGFALGKFSALEVLDAQGSWLQARTRQLQVLAQVHRAAAEFERRLGAPQP